MQLRTAMTAPPVASTGEKQAALFKDGEAATPTATANLSEDARAYLLNLGIKDPDADERSARLLWLHVLAVGYAPAYLTEHAEILRSDWPRVPLPASETPLRTSAALGAELAELLDTERPFARGAVFGRLGNAIRVFGALTTVQGAAFNPDAGGLDLRANWGFATDTGIMGGAGRVESRKYTPDEVEAIEVCARVLGLTVDQAFDCLGHTTCDLYLNEVAYWKNVPSAVWAYWIGGKQVIKKWLSYRERDILGRSLTRVEARYVGEMAGRLATVLLLGPTLDANYRAVTSDTYAWPATSAPTAPE